MDLTRGLTEDGPPVVVVVGAGVTGALTTRALDRLGLNVLLVDKVGMSAGQSSRSHGYVHQGYIYNQDEQTLVADLARAQPLWSNLLEELAVQPASTTSLIGFTSRRRWQEIQLRWQRAGLSVTANVMPSWLAQGASRNVLASTEKTIDMGEFLESCRAQFSDQVDLMKGRVTAIRGRADGAQEVHLLRDGQMQVRTASAVVLAAGEGTNRIVRGRPGRSDPLETRLSYMLVLEGGDLPRTALAFPGHESYGLLIAPRVTEKQSPVWLVSNYLSYLPTRSPYLAHHSRGLWLGSLFEELNRLMPDLFRRSGLRAGVYDGRKTEMQPVGRTVGSHALSVEHDGNVLLASPTKMTLAPLLASEVARLVAARVNGRNADSQTPVRAVRAQRPLRELQVTPEQWRVTELHDIDQIASQYDIEHSMRRH